MDEEEQSVLRKMIWINTSLIFFIAVMLTITMVSVWIDSFNVQAIVFLVVGGVGSAIWFQWNKQIKKNI